MLWISSVMIVTFNTKSTLISLLRNRQMTFPATSSFQFFLKADDKGVFWEDIWVEIMTCLLGSASMRHLKVRILFAKCKKKLHLSHSWVGFALSKRQESVHWDPGGWHNRPDCFSCPSQRLDGWGESYSQLIVTVKPDGFIKDLFWPPPQFWK